MYTQVYDVDASRKIDFPQFIDPGRVFVTFVPKGEDLYLESDEYFNSEISFEGSGQGAIDYLDSLIAKGQEQYAH